MNKTKLNKSKTQKHKTAKKAKQQHRTAEFIKLQLKNIFSAHHKKGKLKS